MVIEYGTILIGVADLHEGSAGTFWIHLSIFFLNGYVINTTAQAS